MAIKNVAGGPVAAGIAQILDSPEVGELIAELDALRWTGRKGSAVEREFGRLKHTFGLVLRTRGLRKAQLHADLVMLARLAQALRRA